MGNPHRGDIEISLDGRPHTLRYTLNALAELAERFAIKQLSDFEKLNDLGVADLRYLLWLGLKKHHADLTERDVGEMEMDLTDVGARIGAAFSASLGGGAPAPEENSEKK